MTLAPHGTRLMPASTRRGWMPWSRWPTPGCRTARRHRSTGPRRAGLYEMSPQSTPSSGLLVPSVPTSIPHQRIIRARRDACARAGTAAGGDPLPRPGDHPRRDRPPARAVRERGAVPQPEGFCRSNTRLEPSTRSACSVALASFRVLASGATRAACTVTWRTTAVAWWTSSLKVCRTGCAWRTSAPTVRRRRGRTSRISAIWTGCWPPARSTSCRPATYTAPVVRWIRNGWWPPSRPRPSRPWPTGSVGWR